MRLKGAAILVVILAVAAWFFAGYYWGKLSGRRSAEKAQMGERVTELWSNCGCYAVHQRDNGPLVFEEIPCPGSASPTDGGTSGQGGNQDKY